MRLNQQNNHLAIQIMMRLLNEKTTTLEDFINHVWRSKNQAKKGYVVTMYTKSTHHTHPHAHQCTHITTHTHTHTPTTPTHTTINHKALSIINKSNQISNTQNPTNHTITCPSTQPPSGIIILRIQLKFYSINEISNYRNRNASGRPSSTPSSNYQWLTS